MAGFDGDGSFGGMKMIGEEFDEGGVGFAVVGTSAEEGDVILVADLFEVGLDLGAGFDFDGN